MTTDGATRLKNNGFIVLCKNNYDFINFFRSIVWEILNVSGIINIVLEMVNSKRSRSLKQLLFKLKLEINESRH